MESVVCNLLLKCGNTGIAFDHFQLKKTFAYKQKDSQIYEREKRKRDFQEEFKKAGKMAGSGLSIVTKRKKVRCKACRLHPRYETDRTRPQQNTEMFERSF